MAEKLAPLQGLIPDFSTMLGLAREAVSRAKDSPADPLAALTACLTVWHLRDWKGGLSVAEVVRNCPWATALDQVANTFKHATIEDGRSERTTSPVKEVSETSGYGMGGWGVGPYGAPYIGLMACRYPGEEPRRISLTTVLDEALAWWETQELPAQ